jgi:glycosyltransferase EpsF
MIRILHIVGKMDRAGAETMLMNLFRNIDRTSVQFDFITFTQEKGDYDDEIIELGGRIFPILAKNPIERMFKLTNFLRQHSEYRIVHAHMLLSNAFHLLAAKRAGVQHRISHSHNTSNGKLGVIAYLYEKFAIYLNKKLSTQKIACGKGAAEYLFGTTEHVWILNNAIDLKLYSQIAEKNRNYWKSIKEDIQGLKIIQVGRLSEVKNHRFSLEIAKKLKEQGASFTFLIVGHGSLECDIRKIIQDNGLDKNVYLLGVRDDIANLMAGADVMLMPSLHEGFPVVLVESQAIGLKSIISSKISKEVDLGVDLIYFKELNDIEKWIEEFKYKNPVNLECNIEVLSKHGFDIKQNAVQLLDFYKNMDRIYNYVN